MLRKTLAAAVLAGAGAVIVTGPGVFAAGGTPADKVVAAGSKAAVFGPDNDVTLLSATMKTSKPTDLMIQPTLECSILTQLTTNNSNPTSNAQSTVRVWVTIDDKIVPIEQISTPPQDGTTPEAGDDSDKVVFCNREYQRTVTDDESPADGIDQTDDYIRTKSSHGFNWVKMNVGSGMHEIKLHADLVTATTGSAAAEAVVGNRTMIVEPTKMANNAVISDTGTSSSGTATKTSLRKNLRHRRR